MAGKTFLQLPPELGGLRFGPFESWIQIGSDPKRNQIVLDPAHGVYPAHCAIGPMPDGRYSVAPASPECKVFILPAGQQQMWPVTSPVQASAGDMVVFGTPSGPRFHILREGPVGQAPTAREIVQTARQTGGERGFIQGVTGLASSLTKPASDKSSGISREIQRRSQASMLASNGPFRMLYVLSTRFRQGQLFSPYMIVGMGIAIIGTLGTGSVTCSGVAYTIWTTLGLEW